MPTEPPQRERLITPSSPERYLCDDHFTVLHYACLFGGATTLRKLIARKSHELNAVDSMGTYLQGHALGVNKVRPVQPTILHAQRARALTFLELLLRWDKTLDANLSDF
jgi:hypothetical protein